MTYYQVYNKSTRQVQQEEQELQTLQKDMSSFVLLNL